LAQNDNGNKKPVDETLAKALAGDAKAQSNVGFLYELGGPDFPQDFAKAAEWYRKAADQGYLLAVRNLANLYKEGKGVPQDYREAEKWYRVGGRAE
jgi:TPR repeat protein